MYKGSSGKKIIGIFFNYDINICVERMKIRKDDPTIKNKDAEIKILEEMSKKMEIPQLNEGFTELYIVSNNEELNKVKIKLG